jgi:phosphoserine phosphatase
MNTVIVHSQDIELATKISCGFKVEIEPRTNHIRVHTSQTMDLNHLRSQYQLDLNFLPYYFDFDNVALFVSDMDSTLINIECIDEIADFANVKAQVASITERAMNGEINFNSALVERVKLLEGLDVNVLNKVYTERLKVNPGGKKLMNFFSSKSIKTAVVSGGFTYFTNQLSKDIGLDYSLANSLGIENAKLTGTIHGDIVDAVSKANFVHELCNIHSVSTEQVIVAGDGANDLEMMSVAGLSVAYHAKPAVYDKADVVINFSGLDKIMDFFND